MSLAKHVTRGRDFQLGSSWQSHYFEEPYFESMTSSEETVESLFGLKSSKKQRKASMGERFFRRKAAVRDIGRLSKMHKNAKSHVVSPLAMSDDFLKAGKAGEIIEQDSSELLVIYHAVTCLIRSYKHIYHLRYHSSASKLHIEFQYIYCKWNIRSKLL